MTELISIPKMMAQKSPHTARRIPALGYHVLEWITHVRELNRFIEKTRRLSAPKALEWALQWLGLSYRATAFDGRDVGTVLPRSSKITVCANHPFGAAEALALLDLLTRRYGTARVPANDLLQVLSPLAPFFIPINKHGANLAYLKRMNAVFTSNAPLLVFPAGRTGRPANGRITGSTIIDFPWARTFLKKSRTHRRILVPVHIRGRNSSLFYTIARIRTALGTRSNWEMLLLVDELMKKRGKTVNMVVGPPIDPHLLDARQTDSQWAEILRTYVQALGDGTPDDFFAWMARHPSHPEQGEQLP